MPLAFDKLDSDPHQRAATSSPVPSFFAAIKEACIKGSCKHTDIRPIKQHNQRETAPTSRAPAVTTLDTEPSLRTAPQCDLWDITDTPTTLKAPPLAEPASSPLQTTSSFLPEDEDIFYTQVATNVRISPNSTTDLTRHAAPSRLLWSSDIFGYTLVGTNLDPSPSPPKGLTPAHPSRLLSSDSAYNTQVSTILDLRAPRSSAPSSAATWAYPSHPSAPPQRPRLPSPIPRLPFINDLFYDLLSDQDGADLTVYISELNVQPLLTSLAPDTEDFFFTDTDVHTNLTLPVPESPFPAIPTPSQTCINLLTRYHPGAAWPLWGPPNTNRSTFPGLAEHPVNLTPPYMGIWDQRLQRSAYQTLGAAVSSVPHRCDGSPGLLPSTRETIIQGCHLTQEQLSAESRHQLGVGAFGSVFRATLANKPELGEVAVKEVVLTSLLEVECFGSEVCMLAQLSDAGGARALAVHGCSLTCGQGPDELLGHIYLQMGERSMHAQMLALGAETTRLTQQWEDDSSVPPHALALLVAGREITVATAFLGYLVDIAHQLTCLHTLASAFLIDLGLSVRRPHGSLYSDAYRGGTAVFRAPECMSGLFSEEAGRASETLDVYATGLLVLYALALGCGFVTTRAIATFCPELPLLLRGMLSTDPGQRPGPAGVAVAFEGMHTALLSAGADLSVQAMAILEQAEIAESVASRCRRQLTVVLDTTEQQLLLSQIDLQALWLVWEEAGCAAELVTFIVGIATFSLPALDAVARVHEVTVVEQWVSRVMAEYKQLLLDMGCPMSLKEAWDSGPALPDLYLSRTALYPW
ncbi:MAG: hypothetical protein WDW38_000968 [Sanguina aurantia]